MGTLITPTTHVKRWNGSSFVNIGNAVRWNGSSWANVDVMLRWNGAAWVYVYTRINLSLSGGGASTASGALSSGSDGSQAFATPSGHVSSSFSWTYQSGDSSILCSNPAAQNPVFSRSFTGVANGTSQATSTAVWRCTMTDITTGAQVYEDRTIGPYQWTNTIPAFSGRTDFITSSQAVETPAGANSLTAYIIGGGAQGGAGYNDGMGTEYIGGGASGAGQCVRTVSGPSGSYSCTIASAGSGLSQGGTSSVSGSGIGASASGGYPGDNAGSGGYGGGAISVGTCSGGDAHYNGNEGFNGAQAGTGGLAGANGGPYNGDYWGYGGNGGQPFGGGEPGKQGIVILVWSP